MADKANEGVRIASIPAELRALPIWVLWRRVPDKDKPGETRKTPFQINGERARSNDPATWTTFDNASKYLLLYEGVGIGISHGYAAVDIDHCVTNGVLSEMAQDIVRSLDTYTEFSPSGTGLRLIFKVGNFDYDKDRYYINNQKIGLEVYVAGVTKKYVTITGNVVLDRPIAENRGGELAIVLEKYMQRPHAQEPVVMPTPGAERPDFEVVSMIRRSGQSARFESLWAGDTTGHGGDASAADLALCNMLAFWTGRNREQMDGLFRQSGLYRPKWDELHGANTYGNMTIDRAVNDCREVYTPRGSAPDAVKPIDYTDTGNAQVFARVYKDSAIYVKSVGWLIWDGKVWNDNDLDARELAIQLTDRMLAEAQIEVGVAGDAQTAAAVADDKEAIKAADKAMKRAEAYRSHAKRSRQSARITGLLLLAQALTQVAPDKLDAKPTLLNTPDGMIDLTTGAVTPHDPAAYCTKITRCAPSVDNAELWRDFLATVTEGKAELVSFLQRIAGMAAIGEVFEENLIIALGDGKNGKSALFNSLAAVMGNYAGTISADVLTTSGKNTGAELATLKGRRLVIAAETEEGARLSSSMVKQLTSTDRIHAERKYKDPEDFMPTHSVVLYTNHLPRVGSTDSGTWRRLVVIPFGAKITATQEVKNYADKLTRGAGGAIMSWIVEGARLFIEAKHKLDPPTVVQLSVAQYKQENDWLGAFIAERCNESGHVAAGKLYEEFRYWAERNGEYKRSRSDFNTEMERRGYEWRKTMHGNIWSGVSLFPLGFERSEESANPTLVL